MRYTAMSLILGASALIAPHWAGSQCSYRPTTGFDGFSQALAFWPSSHSRRSTPRCQICGRTCLIDSERQMDVSLPFRHPGSVDSGRPNRFASRLPNGLLMPSRQLSMRALTTLGSSALPFALSSPGFIRRWRRQGAKTLWTAPSDKSSARRLWSTASGGLTLCGRTSSLANMRLLRCGRVRSCSKRYVPLSRLDYLPALIKYHISADGRTPWSRAFLADPICHSSRRRHFASGPAHRLAQLPRLARASSSALTG